MERDKPYHPPRSGAERRSEEWREERLRAKKKISEETRRVKWSDGAAD